MNSHGKLILYPLWNSSLQSGTVLHFVRRSEPVAICLWPFFWRGRQERVAIIDS